MPELMTPPLRTDRQVTEYPSDPELLSLVLRPYRAKRCEYLKAAVVTADRRSADDTRISTACVLEIPESCYIDDTGHFNSVEFNICYNQMLYYTVAKAVRERIAEPFSGWSEEDFWDRQLKDFLITDFRSAFRSAMRGRRFEGELEITDVAQWEGSDIRDPLLVIRTACRYWDETGGDCRGEVTIAVTNPPTVGR
jgi:hypothetical protein